MEILLPEQKYSDANSRSFNVQAQCINTHVALNLRKFFTNRPGIIKAEPFSYRNKHYSLFTELDFGQIEDFLHLVQQEHPTASYSYCKFTVY